jgi:hypothetical protein
VRAGALITVAAILGAEAAESKISRIVFEQQTIEGKIRRPQLVLIKADERPEFSPMVIQSVGKSKNIVGFVDRSVLESSPYDGAFQFRGTEIEGLRP